ncbi:hypothetical protein [Streptomyces albidoflavus]|uniref:hypothetical protein n=1 Tax=Streptomyces albidoflavus TaxID=1886 RepID=UPI0005264055|nr:hypothetical protein [Streptomyces albidoflavus]
MARRPLPLAALTAAAALTLTACGGSGEPDDIKGAGGSASAEPSEQPEGSDKGRPSFTMPKSFKLEFRDWRSDDPSEQAILDDGREQLRAGYAAIGEGDPDADYFAFYNTKVGLSGGKEWIKSYSDKNVTVIGELPVYDAKAALVGKGDNLASLTYCTDESKAYTENRETGKKVGNPEGTEPTVQYVTTLRKSEEGVWQTDNVKSERGAC